MSQPDNPLIWIDNSLSPLTALGLKAVGYNVVVQADIPEFRQLRRVLDDEHIIPWIAGQDGIWAHADNNARTEHAKQLSVANIRTIWVYIPPGTQMSSRDQLRLLAYALPDILIDFAAVQPLWRHYEVRPQGRRISVRGFMPQ